MKDMVIAAWILSLVILLGIFGSSQIGLYFLCLSLPVLLYALVVNRQGQGSHWWWAIFFLGLGISTLRSHDLSVSFYALVWWIFNYLVFNFLVGYRITKAWRLIFAEGITFIGVMFCGLSLLFLYFEDLATLLPGVNIFFPTYGHNHLAAYLLLVIPITWWLFKAFTTPTKKLITAACLVILYLGLLTSFGRVAIVVGLLETIALTLILTPIFGIKNRLDRFTRDFGIGMIVVMVLVLGLKVVFSVYLSDQPLCQNLPMFFQRTVCKSLSQEPRGLYWQQAWQAFKEFPVFGYGPGTFELINQRYRQAPEVSTSYAHNFYLQSLGELGVVGGVPLLLLVVSLFWVPLKKAIHLPANTEDASRGWVWALMIAISASYLNALFDFDWNIPVVLMLTFVFLGLAINTLAPGWQIPRLARWATPLRVLLVLATAAYIAGYTIQYVRAELLLSQKQVTAAFEAFPDSELHKRQYWQRLTWFTPTQLQRAEQSYGHDPQFWIGVENNSTEVSKKIIAAEHLYQLSPWQQTTTPLETYYLQHGDLGNAQRAYDSTLTFFDTYGRGGWRALEFHRRQQLATVAIAVANHKYDQTEFETAGRYYQQAFELYPWSWAESELSFLDCNAERQSLRSIYQQLNINQAEAMGSQYQPFLDCYIELVTQDLQQGDTQSLNSDVQKIMALESQRRDQVWTVVSQHFMNRLTPTSVVTPNGRTQLQAWVAVWQLFAAESETLDGNYRQYLAELVDQVQDPSLPEPTVIYPW